MALRDTICKNVKALRLERGLTQQQLADKARLNVRYVSKLENRSQNISVDLVETLAKALGCTPLQLIGDGRGASARKAPTEDFDKAIRLLASFRAKLNIED